MNNLLQMEQQAAANKRWMERAKRRADKKSAAERGDWKEVETVERIAQRSILMGNPSLVASVLNNPHANILESVIDTRDFVPAFFLLMGAHKVRSVARIEVGGASRGLGTGFLVSPRLLMTNHHVLPTPEVARASLAQFDYYDLSPGRPFGEPRAFRLDVGTFFIANRDLDFALVAVEATGDGGQPLEERGWSPLISGSGKALFSEPVFVLQHPEGRRMETVVSNNSIVDVPDDDADPFIYYAADTQPGSSGSPVFNRDWDLAALHHAGVGSGPLGGRPEGNEGIRISAIVKWLDDWSRGRNVEQRRLLAEAKVKPPALPIFREASATPSPRVGAPRVQGNEIWLPISVEVGLRLGGTPVIPAAIADQGPGDDVVVTKAPAGGAGSPIDANARQLGEKLLEGFEDLPYYDEAGDVADALDYYMGIASSLSKASRYTKLSQLLESTHATKVSYSSARLKYLYPWVDLHEDEDGKRMLRSVYSGEGFDALEIIASDIRREAELLGQEYFSMTRDQVERQLERLETENQFNCEHVVPQSWFDKEMPMVGDLHHLFTCEMKCNSFRGNTPYFQFTTEVMREKCGRRENGTGEYHKFEPAAGKGAVARATLYFLMRYPAVIGDDARELQRDRLDVLLAWHQEELPALWEKHRNAAIFKIQGNRNPLIDHPEWSSNIDFAKGFAA